MILATHVTTSTTIRHPELPEPGTVAAVYSQGDQERTFWVVGDGWQREVSVGCEERVEVVYE